MEAPETKMVN